MLDGVTLDQLRTFIAAAEEGSFSAAGRKLRRAQSVVSQTLANLEAQLGVMLFDRTARYPQLTEAGRFLLIDARAVANQIDGFKARARAMRDGLEPELSVVVDVMYPMSSLTHATGLARAHFPHTPLRLYVEALGAVIQPVLDGTCTIGIMGSLPLVPSELVSEPLGDVPFATVVSPDHPLAGSKGVLPKHALRDHVQLVLTDRSSLSAGKDIAVLSPQTWRLADLGSKLAFLRAGFGWGHMPRHMVQEGIERGELVEIKVEGFAGPKLGISMHIVYRKDAPPGPAGRHFIAQLKAADDAGLV
ncbi:LysR family transcriptional regulator [Xanthomonas sp. NCPPB 3005]|uniref:LysR family transcriptional regulator n=1 Tax=Xanthomonas sp. NCPPB 3005 TaxID=3240913 RepID=UPI00355A74AC